MRHTTQIFAVMVMCVLGQACDDDDAGPTDPDEEAQVLTASGTADLAVKVNEFRAWLGKPDNGSTPDQQPSGRREVMWEFVPAELTNVDTFPGDFTNTQVARGALLQTEGTGFRVSDNDFVDVAPAYDFMFNTFSPPKLFAPVGSHIVTVTFQVAGESTPAAVTGIGVVFSDVDLADSTYIQLYDRNNQSLGVYRVPVRSDEKGMSFLGVKFTSPLITRARIASGTAALGPGVKDLSNGGTNDLAVMDEVIYGEPQALQ